MQPDQVWNLEKIKKIMVELNGDGQGSDNGSNLLVRFLGKLSQKSVLCPISVVRWDRMPEEKIRLQWQLIETLSSQNASNKKKLKVAHAGGSKSNARRGRQMDKISEHLTEDQERAATLGVPLKILVLPNDAIEKVCGVVHSGRVHGLGGNICPSIAFGMPRHSISHANTGSSSNMSHQRVEDLEKHVETLKEKLIGYEETKEKLEDTKEKLEENKKRLMLWFASDFCVLIKH